jgi:murein L,D-transpeptidase YcbB/YkuD
MEQWKHQTKTWTQNPMGLVKFMFPECHLSTRHTYKSLFEFDYRAFSHGCINMDKAKELAIFLKETELDRRGYQ